MKKILVPCDFSKPAVNAFRLALDLAAVSKGTIHLVHVVELPVLHDSLLMPVLNFEEQLLKELRDKSEKDFGKMIKRYNAGGVKVETSVQFGHVFAVVLNYITDKGIDQVVMGSHGASGLREFFIGSNAEKIVRRSSVPVIIVKDYFKGQIKNIVFPNTLEPEGQDDLIENVKALQQFFKAQLHIVWINSPLNFTSDVLTNARLEDFIKKYKFKNCTANIFNHADEEEGILAFTKVIDGDLIAMGTHSRKGVGRLVNGSLAEDVTNHTDKLVWTYTMTNESVPG